MDKKIKNTLPTIKLQGKDYVQVKDRLLFFNENYPNGCIQTEILFNEKGVSVKATVTPDVDKPERSFIGRSYGEVDNKDKSFEKLETVAVGRTLAFMGIGVIESVASADEIESYHKKLPMKERNQVIATTGKETMYSCTECGVDVLDNVAKYSNEHQGRVLCYNCQKKNKGQ